MTATVQSAANPSQAIYSALNTSRDSAATKDVDPQDRFLKLLVTQLRNQDPLNPMDNAQMTSQLAQISTVDGIDKLNQTLQKLIDGSNDNQALQAAALVGHGVLVPGSGFVLSDGMAIGGVDLGGAADSVTVTIKDSAGLVVKTVDLGAHDAGSISFSWDGTTDSGAKAANGAYSISVSARQGGQDVAAKALELGVVSSVARTSQGVSLNLGALGMFKMSDVIQIL